MTTRESLHALVDEWPESELEELEDWLNAARGRKGGEPISDEAFLKILEDAPFDDEPLTEDDLAAIRRSRESSRPRVPHEEVEQLLDRL